MLLPFCFRWIPEPPPVHPELQAQDGLKGRAQGMEKVIKTIDDMVALLGKDQADDEKQSLLRG